MTPRGPSRADRTEKAVEELRAATNQEAFKLRAELLQHEQRLEATEQALAEIRGEFTELRGELAASSSGGKGSKKKRSKADYSEKEITRLRAEKARTRRAAQLKKQSAGSKGSSKEAEPKPAGSAGS